jgi:eukaryotic-like serine/threonine-protein kinase
VSTFGRFEIVQELGRGGMGVVFRAHDPAMARDVALKVLRLDPGLEPAQMDEIGRRFEREAQAAGALNHPNIVASYERGEIGGHKFIVMEFVEGSALHKAMSEGPRPSVQASLGILRQIAAGLDYAHSRGVIHRDIKPANVLLPKEGNGAKIADFGIAKATLGGSITMSSSVLGSPHYMSPEQIEGRQVTGRADQWSLAVTAYELLAGRKPFDSDSVAALFQQILATQPRDPSEFDTRIPSAARRVFERALNKSPGERFESCTAFVEALAAAAAAPEPSNSGATRLAPPRTRPRLALWAALAFAAGLAACAGLAFLLPNLPGTLAKRVLHAQAAQAKGVPATDPSLKMGQTRVNRRDNLTYVWIAPGAYRMGCSEVDSACRDDETPHQVTLTRGFWIGQSEVTAKAFRHYTLAAGTAMPKSPDDNPGWKDESMPISNVSWSAAGAYCGWAGGRLPTEAEWEFAARGGSEQLRYGAIEQTAWYKGNSSGHTQAVKTLAPNPYGLYDMLGNVWEWTADFYGRDFYGIGPASDPQGPQTGEYRVARGGSWMREPSDIRVSLRYPTAPDNPDQGSGMRCAANDMP